MSGVLPAIVAAARRAAEVRATAAHVRELDLEAATRHPRPEAFRATLAAPGLRVIAECKPRSPSKGILRPSYDPASIARGYESAGAAAISVLTEPTFFDGDLDHLRAVRASTTVPVLRKDFIVTDFQILEARAAGADAVLLIVAALDNEALRELLKRAHERRLAALVEVHSREELVRALDAGAEVVGVNSRDLSTLDVTPAIFDELAPGISNGVIAVAESGLTSAGELRRLKALRYDAFLIGERFMTAPDPGAALATMLAEGTEEPRR